jgi:hypothetical protein
MSIPLPAGSPSAAAPTPSPERLGRLLLILVAGLAFLLASFPARNSDVWLHLARGRLVAHGQAPSTTAPDLAFDLWGNQTWLYDFCCYVCHAALGGVGLVIVKALLTAGIALLLLWQSRSAPEWCVPALCTSLALLTMSKYLALQPATVSYFFLALALAFLRGPKTAEDNAPPPFLSWPLLILFVVWANMDRWFLLGLGVVGLAWLGEVLDAAFTEGASPKRWQATLLRRGCSFLALAAVCLLNPSRLEAFVLIDELRGLGLSASQLISPFEGAYFAAAGRNPASLAYFLLLGLSLISFAALLPQLRWQRFLPWLGLALLTIFQMRAIPFFAVVAGPVLAWNIRDVVSRHFRPVRAETERMELLRLGRVLTAVLILVLLVCAWPGWLQSPPYGMRRWGFDLSPSLERAAATIHGWHEEGKLGANSGGLHLSAETVFAFAWFCPEEKRLRLTHQDSAAEWRRRMREEDVDHVLVSDSDRDRLASALSGLVADPEQWPQLDQEGDVAVFGWRDPERAGSANLFRGWEMDLARRAFHPDQDKKAPAESVDPQESAGAWWQAFWKPVPPRSIDRDEALMYLLYAEALQREAPLRHLTRWVNSQTAALVAAGSTWASPTALCDAQIRLALTGLQFPEEAPASARPSPLDRLAVGFQRSYTLQRDDAPPALFYLAVRAARRAVAADPDDAPAHLLLGEGYLGLLDATRERAWGTQFPQLVKLRQNQASFALNRALALRPDFAQAHFQLARLYQRMGYLDLTLKHLQTYYRLAREAGPPRGVDRETFNQRQAQNSEDVDRLTREVQKRESSVALRSTDSPPRERANQALRNGLAGKALEILLESDRSAFGDEGMKLELELLLDVGRARDVQKWLSPEDENVLTSLSYHWLLARAAAATGDYTRAEEECDEAARTLTRLPGSSESLNLLEKQAFMTTKLVLDSYNSKIGSFSNFFGLINQAMLGEQLQATAQIMRQQSDLTALHGLLALEEGEMSEAESSFRAALALRKGQSVEQWDRGWDFNARSLAYDCLLWLQ